MLGMLGNTGVFVCLFFGGKAMHNKCLPHSWTDNDSVYEDLSLYSLNILLKIKKEKINK